MKACKVKNHEKIASKLGRFEINNNAMYNLITKYLADYYGIPYLTLMVGRKKEVALKRQTIQYFLTIFTTYTYAEIGYLTGLRDHASINNSIKVIDNEMEIYAIFKVEIDSIYKGIEKLIMNQINE